MIHRFYKYQGTGNDFVIFDNRTLQLPQKDVALYNKLCNRKFGIGADGLMLLQNKDGYDFEMIYFNADGSESTMCGNGARCLVAFAKKMKIIDEEARFLAVDGPHYAKISSDKVYLQMIDVPHVRESQNGTYILDTGSPHYVQFVRELENLDVYGEGKSIRYSEEFKQQGINVNFVEEELNSIYVRTYERGVEDETLSCGTGVTASAIAFALKNDLWNEQIVSVSTKGGSLSVSFNRDKNGFHTIFLIGPAQLVFEGEIAI